MLHKDERFLRLFITTDRKRIIYDNNAQILIIYAKAQADAKEDDDVCLVGVKRNYTLKVAAAFWIDDWLGPPP